jgi:hypothetical protein
MSQVRNGNGKFRKVFEPERAHSYLIGSTHVYNGDSVKDVIALESWPSDIKTGHWRELTEVID